MESGKLLSSCLSSRLRDPGAVVDPTLRSAAPFNNDLFRLVGSLSAKRSVNLSFDEAAKVESLVKGLTDLQSISFWLFSTFLHWLKELGFVPRDAALFEQLVQSLSLSLVNVVSVLANFATFFQAKPVISLRMWGSIFESGAPHAKGFGWVLFLTRRSWRR